MKLLAPALFLAVLQFSPAHSEASVTPADCDTIETDAGVALDLVNRHRRDGYVLGLFRVVDAYKQDVGNSSVLYLTLDVLETECSVLSGRPWASCEYSNAYSQVFGQCKIVTYTSQWMKNKQHLYGFNCTVSPVPPDLTECEDCPVKVKVLEVTEQHKDVAAKALEKYNSESNHTSHFNVDKVEKILKMTGSREGHVVEFSIKETNCSKRAAQHTDTQLECGFLDGWRAQKGFCKATIDGPEEREGTDITCELYHPWHLSHCCFPCYFYYQQHHCGQKCSSLPPCRPHKHPHHRGGHGHRHGHRHPPHFAPKDSEHHHNFSEEHQDSHEGHPPPPPHGRPHHRHPPHHHCPPPPPQEEAHDPASHLLKDESHPPPPPQNETHHFHHPPHQRPPHPHPPPHHDGPHHFPHPPHHGPFCPHPPPHHDGPDHPPHPPHHGPPCPHHPHHHGPPHPPHPPHHGPHCPPPHHHGPHHHGPHHHGPPHPHHPPHHGPHCPPPPPPGHPHHYHRHPFNKTSGKHFPFQRGAVYRIPVLNQQDTLTLPLSNFLQLSQSDPHFSDTAEGSHFTGSGQEKNSGIHDFPHHPSQSKSCPGKPKRHLPHILLLLSQESAAKTSPK